jgi:hypothetical protein
MDRQLEEGNLGTVTTQKKPYSSGHLMCRTPLWGLAGFAGCAYFAWVSFAHVLHNEYEWPHDYWTAGTYLVWIVLLAALAYDTRCLRERLFFGVLVVNFVVGCGLTLWRHIPDADVRSARIATGVLWALAALLSLTTLGKDPELQKKA